MLDTNVPQDLTGLEVAGARVAKGSSFGGFGFLLLENEAGGYGIEIYDPKGRLERRCRLRERRAECSPSVR